MTHAEIVPALRPWPEPIETYDRQGKQRYYKCPDGVERVSVTTALKALGLGQESLIGWAARTEKAAALEAVKGIFEWGRGMTGAKFIEAVEERMGKAKAHIAQMEKAGDIGTQVHAMIQWYLRGVAGLLPGDQPALSSEATVGWMAWLGWWEKAELKPVRVEQSVWDGSFAGTIDLIAENAAGQLEVWDWKSSSYIYMKHHVQVAAYMKAAREWRPISAGYILRVPKSLKDLKIEVKPVGEMWDFDRRRTVVRSESELFHVFLSALATYRILMESPA